MGEAPRDSAVELVIEARARPVGNVQVARVLPVAQRRQVGPFVFLDHMGPVSFAPGNGIDVAPHPHIGLSTVTYLFEGEILHRDSLGSVQLIRPGEVNLMTAGRGVVHSERSEQAWRASGGTLHAAQLWLGLPLAHEEEAPSFEHRSSQALPLVSLPGAQVRVLLGAVFGARSPTIHPADPLLLDVQLEAGASLELPPGEQRALCAIEGELAVGAQTCARDQMLVFKPSVPAIVKANQHSRFLLLGGPPLDGPRLIDWNFVSSSKERIEEAKANWRARAFPLVPGDEIEFVPLHENH